MYSRVQKLPRVRGGSYTGIKKIIVSSSNNIFYIQIHCALSPHTCDLLRAHTHHRLCADVIVSAAVRRSISVGGGAPPGPKKRGGGGGGGGGGAEKKFFFIFKKKFFFFPQYFF